MENRRAKTLRIIGGVFTIIACSFVILLAAVMFEAALHNLGYRDFQVPFLIAGMFGIFSCALGLTAAILSFRGGKYLGVVIVGICLVLFSGIFEMLAMVWVDAARYGDFDSLSTVFGLTTVMLSLVALRAVLSAKREYAVPSQSLPPAPT